MTGMSRDAVAALLLLLASSSCIEAVAAPPEALCGNGALDEGEACDGSAADGAADCRQDCTLPSCGNGVVDPGEDCDWRAGTGPRCTQACRLDHCGDLRLDPGEACDPGAPGSAPCNPDCTLSVCGDGVVGDDEVCEPGLEGPCRGDCQRPVCGDGAVDASESCDEGPANGRLFATCTQRCTVPSCGDGLVSRPAEACDGGAACGADCRFVGCGAVAIAALDPASLVARADGALFVTGDVWSMEIETLLPPDRQPGLVRIPDAPAFVALVGRAEAAAGLTAEGRLFLLGETGFGRAADGTLDRLDPPAAPIREPLPDARFVDVVATARGFLALASDGALWAVGGDGSGELGPVEAQLQSCTSQDQTLPCVPSPARVTLPEGFAPVRLFAGDDHAGALDAHGVAWLWGSNQWRQLGTDVFEACPIGAARCLPPRRLDARVSAAAGSRHASLFLSPDGLLWGFGGTTILGDGGTDGVGSRHEPLWLPGPADERFVELVAAGTVLLARTADGRLFGAGEANYGQLGTSEPPGLRGFGPVLLQDGAPIVALATAGFHSLGLRADGRVVGWGDRRFERLGAPAVAGAEPLPAEVVLETCP